MCLVFEVLILNCLLSWKEYYFFLFPRNVLSLIIIKIINVYLLLQFLVYGVPKLTTESQ